MARSRLADPAPVRRQPGRDRAPHPADRRSTGDRGHRTRHRGTGRRRPPRHRRRGRRGRRPPMPTPCTRASASSPRTPTSPTAVEAAGIAWVGPPPERHSRHGRQGGGAAARDRARRAVVPGYDGADQTDAALAPAAKRIGYPLLVKPAAGGGGKGMRTVREPGHLADALASARREAVAAFGDDRLILERFVEGPRHVEVQVLFDAHGPWHPPRRARLLDAAAPPEGARGDARAGRHARDPRRS